LSYIARQGEAVKSGIILLPREGQQFPIIQALEYSQGNYKSHPQRSWHTFGGFSESFRLGQEDFFLSNDLSGIPIGFLASMGIPFDSETLS